MTEPADRDLLELQRKAFAAIIDRLESSDARADKAFAAIIDRLESSDARADERHRTLIELYETSDRAAAERHRALMERQVRGERIFVEAIGDIDQSMQRIDRSIQRNTDRLDDMGEAIRANTRAVLSVLDRIEPQSD